ncbi:hypothetical protein BDL97_04G079200 [Sphagnum fallax]|nr:hypothetical protein BDL97_04G079200 [Sphagnum fallax]
MEEQLCQEFATNNFVVENDEAAQQCASMCITFGLKPGELVSSWELFYLNRQMDGGRVLNSHLASFRQFLERERRESFRKKQTGLHFYTEEDIDMLLDDGKQNGELEENPLPGTPRAVSANKQISNPNILFEGSVYEDPDNLTPPPVASKTRGVGTNTPGDIFTPKFGDTPFGRRSNKCTVQSVFNEHLVEETSDSVSPPASEEEVVRRIRPIQRCQLDVIGTWPKSGCRYMFDHTENRVNAIERRMQKFATSISEKLQCNLATHVAVASQEKVTVVGRLCCEGEGRLNEKSVLLEGSIEHSNGMRVRLDLRNVSQFSLFPGQVMVVEGQNPSGYCLVASRILDASPLPLLTKLSQEEDPPAKRQAIHLLPQDPVQSETSHQLCILTAAGPFTTSDNLAYEPFVELLAYARKKRPNLLVLMGPFVDRDHPHIKQGNVDKTFANIFEEQVRARVEEYCEEMGEGARVLLVPSYRDAHHDCIFPQPPFDANGFEDPDRQITLLANPGLIKCNEITMGCCTADVLRHLSSEEVSRAPPGVSSDRMTRLASHLLAQRSFYPLFPAAQGVSLDLSLAPGSLDLPCTPDLLLLPSNLAPFVKVLSVPLTSSLEHIEETGNVAATVKSICVNPGHLAKGITGGTFAEILIVPYIENAQSQILESRAKVTIMRI